MKKKDNPKMAQGQDQDQALEKADKIFNVKEMIEARKIKKDQMPPPCQPNSPGCGKDECPVHNSILDKEDQMRLQLQKEKKNYESKMKDDKITAAALQFRAVDNGAPMSIAEKAKRLVLRTGIKTYNTAIARRLSVDGLFGLNSTNASTLELELNRQATTERTLSKIDQNIQILQYELATKEDISKFTANRLKKQIKQLEQRKKITTSMKSNKYEAMQSRVSEEIQKKFNFSKVVHAFEVQLRDQQKEIFLRAEQAKHDLSEPQPDEAKDAKKSAKKKEAEEVSRMKVGNMSLDELRAKKRVNDLEAAAMGTTYGFLLFDDLQFSAVARGKMYQEEDFNEGDRMLKKNMRRRSMRRKVIQEDLSEDISAIEDNFNERDVRIKAGEMKPRRKLRHNDSSESDELSSDGMSHFDSDASRVNFWKDINTRDDEYGGAVIVRRPGGEQAGDQNDEVNASSTAPKLSKAQQMRKGMKKQTKNQPVISHNSEYLQMKIAKMETEFEITKKNIKKVAIDNAVAYFKDKTIELSALYTNETLRLLQQYTTIRNDSLDKDEIIKKVARLVDNQENIIAELRQFIEEHLTPILQLIEREREGIYKHYRKAHKRDMDDAQKDDPLSMFGYYGKDVSKKKDSYIIDEMQEYINQLEFKTTAMASELQVVHDATDLLLRDGLTLEEQIRKMNQEIYDLKEENKRHVARYKFDIAEKEYVIKSQQESFQTERAHLVGLAKVESELSTVIQNELNSILTDTRKQLRYVKNVLRTPRLYEFYRGLMMQEKQKDALKQFIMDQLTHKIDRDSIIQGKKNDNDKGKEMDVLMTENSTTEKLAAGEAFNALKTAMEVGFDNPDNADVLLKQANINESTGLLYPHEGCPEPEDIMKQVKQFDIKEEARKVVKGNLTKQSDLTLSKQVNTTESDSIPRTGSPIIQQNDSYSGNPINLIKHQRFNKGTETLNSSGLVSPTPLNGNYNQFEQPQKYLTNKVNNQTASPQEGVSRQNPMQGIQNRKNGVNASMFVTDHQKNKINADLDLGSDSQSIIKSGQSINQWAVQDSKQGLALSKQNTSNPNDRYYLNQQEEESPQIGGLVGTSIAAFCKEQNDVNQFKQGGLQETLKTMPSFKIECDKAIQESNDEAKTQSSGAGIIILTGKRGLPKHQIMSERIINQPDPRKKYKNSNQKKSSNRGKNLSNSTNFRTVSPKSSNLRKVAQDAKEHQEQEQMLLSNRQIRQQLEVQKQKYEFLLKEHIQGRAVGYKENLSHRIFSAAKKQLSSTRSGVSQNITSVKTPASNKQPQTKIIANLTNQVIPVQYVEDQYAYNENNEVQQAEMELWKINQMSDKALSHGSQTGLQSMRAEEMVIHDPQDPILATAPRKAERTQLPISGQNYRHTFDGNTEQNDSQVGARSMSGRGAIMIPKIKAELGLDQILQKVAMEELENKKQNTLKIKSEFQDSKNPTLKSFCSAILTKAPEKNVQQSRVQSTTEFQIPIINSQRDRGRFLALRPKTGVNAFSQNMSGDRVPALRGHMIEMNNSSNTNIFGTSPMGPGSDGEQMHLQAISGSGENILTSADAKSSLKQDYQLKNAIKGTGVTIKRLTSGNVSYGSRAINKSQNLRMSLDHKFTQYARSPEQPSRVNHGDIDGQNIEVNSRLLFDKKIENMKSAKGGQNTSQHQRSKTIVEGNQFKNHSLLKSQRQLVGKEGGNSLTATSPANQKGKANAMHMFKKPDQPTVGYQSGSQKVQRQHWNDINGRQKYNN